jgi:hypothetical protein
LLGLLLAIWVGTVQAQAPERQQRFVYGLNAFDGVEYTTGFIPPSVSTIYLFADQVAVLDPKLTEVYFWPITGDHRADFTALNQLVEGKLEITLGGRALQTINLTEYLVQIDPGAGNASGQVHLGGAASERWNAFLAERAAYVARLRAHAEATAEFNRQLDEARARGVPPASTTPPPEPSAFSLYSSEVGRGFAITLPAGTYGLRLRGPDGAIVADSQKQLEVVAPRRVGIGYDVVPQEKWTRPERASDEADVIYVDAGSVVFLQPHAAIELDAVAHARMRNPQDAEATPGRWTWLNVGALPPSGMTAAGRTIQRGEFAVEQLPGAALGYRVVPQTERADSTRPPDITAYRIEAPPTRGAVRAALLGPDGRELPGSARQIVVLSNVKWWQLLLPAIIPLAIGLTIILRRRQQVLTTRSLSAEQRQLIA